MTRVLEKKKLALVFLFILTGHCAVADDTYRSPSQKYETGLDTTHVFLWRYHYAIAKLFLGHFSEDYDAEAFDLAKQTLETRVVGYSYMKNSGLINSSEYFLLMMDQADDPLKFLPAIPLYREKYSDHEAKVGRKKAIENIEELKILHTRILSMLISAGQVNSYEAAKRTENWRIISSSIVRK